MRSMRLPAFAAIVAMIALLLEALPSIAGGPLGGVGNVARRYPTGSFPLTYRTDMGKLGAFSNATATAITDFAFQQWDNIATAALSFSNGGSLPRDVSSATDAFISGPNQFSDGVNPVVFDNDGSITDAYFGVGAKNGVLGFAGSVFNGTSYTEGFAIINGFLTGDGSQSKQDQYKATITHEIGHFLGLAHSQVTMHGEFCTMYPTVVSSAQRALGPDDIAAMSELYPAPGYVGTTGSISGTVRSKAGANLSGVNVIAVDSASGASYSTMVDYFSGPNARFTQQPATVGTYTLAGLPPGRYFIRIEPINPLFIGGSNVGSYDPPMNTTILREWYNGGLESGDLLLDNANDKVGIPIAAGSNVTGINIVANESNTLSDLRYDNGTPGALFALPNGAATKLATRFTAPGLGSLVGVRLFVGEMSDLPMVGSMTVTVHANAPGSAAGVPGLALGSVTIPFRDLAADQMNEIYLRGIGSAINFPAGTEFHVAISTNAQGSPVLYVDNGSPVTNRTSYYTTAGGWRNMGDGPISQTYNLMMTAIYSSTVVGNPAPALLAEPSTIDFGRARPGDSVEKTVVIRNTGTAQLDVNATNIGGSGASEFRIVSGGGAFSLIPGASRSILLRFVPTTSLPSITGSLSISSNVQGGATQIPLTARSTAPRATALMTSLTLASVAAGQSAITDTVVLKNTGNDTLRFKGGSIDGADAGTGIRLAAFLGAKTILPDSSLRVSIRFQPSQRRSYSARLVLRHDDRPDTTFIAIEGEATGAALDPADGTIDLGSVQVGTSGEKEFVITNQGSGTVTITAADISGLGAGCYEIVGITFPVTIPPGSTLTIRIRFAPTAVGSCSGTLRLTTSAGDFTYTLSGNGNDGTNGVERSTIARGASSFTLEALTPSPAHDRTQVRWSVRGGLVVEGSITLVDMTGATVALVTGGPFAPGEGSRTLDLRELPAGVYFVVATIGGEQAVRRLVVTR